ncbi:MAG: tRNA (N6-isopentenyl adenosine(37)-C2)-methylthiotransferase MiaB [Epulopiscium sp.]|jgi:tRNA-2-methylthio-N6-dimethylallyladenosine synthase|nr:tRNA (N6-isopentenyl adenosine(37)-C2)-methylthiotransferase MiaB [Candidatus Epulonipiscium sp.]
MTTDDNKSIDEVLLQEELQEQMAFMQKIKKENLAYTEETGKHRYFYNLAMGCQMNAHDSEKLEGMLTEMGYLKTTNETDADFIIYNTCCIRENAEQKVYGKLGWLKHYKKSNPDAIVALCGCMMQQDTVLNTIKSKYKHVDIIFGTFNLYKLPELIATRKETGEMTIDIWEENRLIVENVPTIPSFSYKGAVNIMYGCDNFCAYCIVPYVRGRERSRNPEDILAEIRGLVSQGMKEILLLGQNVNSYGKKLDSPITFAELLRQVNEVEGLERIRFMTSHPKDLSDDLIAAMRDCDKVCHYLHLPVQSGSTNVLRRMNRKYTKESYLELVRKVKSAIPDIAISTDIIVGFPGETEEDFQDTLDVIREVRYSTAFTFLYSKRTGTPAATMEDQVPEDVMKDRFDRLLKVLNPLIHEENHKQIGTTQMVLVEEVSKQKDTILTGRTDNNTLVHFEGSKELIGSIVPVKIVDNKTFYLIGERI